MNATSEIRVREAPREHWTDHGDGNVWYIGTDSDGWIVGFFAKPGQEQAEAEKVFQHSVVLDHKRNHERMRELHASIATHLDGWAYQETELPGDHWYGSHFRYEIRNQDGHSFDLRILSGADRGKVQVTGNWPRRDETPGASYVTPSEVRESSPSIKRSLDRGYQAIARDIVKRFLPEYVRVYGKIQERIRADREYSGRKASNWATITQSGFVVNPRERNGEHVAEVRIAGERERYDYSAGYGDVRMTGDDSVEIKLNSLPVETALRVLRALAEGGSNA